MRRRLRSAPALGFLTAGFVALVVAFRVLPAAISDAAYPGYAREAALRGSLADGLVAFWRAGGPGFPPGLQRLVDYWRLWHETKIVICVLLVLVLGLLASGLWHRYLEATRRGRAWAGAAGVVTVLVVLAAGVLAANVQATAAPSIALLPLVPDRPAASDLGQTLAAVTTGLSVPGSPEAGSAALAALRGDVERYHWVMVVTAGLFALVAAGVAVRSGRRRRAAQARVRTMSTVLGVLSGVAAVLFLLLAANSLVSALTPSDALLAVLGIG